MKYAIIIPDGAADEPQSTLEGKTPLEAARTPEMDAIAAAGVVARACHTPAVLPAGSEVGNMSLLGYDPLINFTGRAPIEAAAQGIELSPEDWAIRCNLVTIEDQIMKSFTAGHISTEEATELLASAQEMLGGDGLEFVPGVSYRNLLIWRGNQRPAPFTMEMRATPPHDLTDKSVLDNFPRGPGSDVLNDLMAATIDMFANHPVNKKRIAAGKPPATNIWLWGIGKAPKLAPFAQVYGPQGAMITAVDLLRGLATLVGWQRIEVPGATGYTDTDYSAKGRYAVDALKEVDLICVHVEAPDEASHEGDCGKKVAAIEEIDTHVVGPVLEALKSSGDWRIMISPDHPTYLSTKTHTHGHVPVAIAGTGIEPDQFISYGDTNAANSQLAFDEGWRTMGWFTGKSK
ncbi:cofactor-independent phosphoglycerate mutase [Bythopirellula polymerisocia]|uniref:Cofactor-independent phosphoglycerate mutase n=1 Tax=Bythopirellula polymerisocia TaxID=2528003 RepID=A0A5C6D016_9BACT|nr:cofactor-independent phosphoglycerate mutase [Bythopirellula polymerisocia]TWU28546.1 cofactor-independent phosphoglycerate mutase [Bythopirellula polymerisocia]